MGRIIRAICRKCGYRTSNLYFGNGKTDLVTTCQFPVLDKKTREVIMKDISLKDELPNDSDHFLFYDDSSLSGDKNCDQPLHIDWGDIRLKSRGNYCPKCHQFSLEFLSHGLWD